MKKMNFEWERIYRGDYCETKRAKVIGGWIVCHREIFDGDPGESSTSLFISDPKHEWNVNEV